MCQYRQTEYVCGHVSKYYFMATCPFVNSMSAAQFQLQGRCRTYANFSSIQKDKKYFCCIKQCCPDIMDCELAVPLAQLSESKITNAVFHTIKLDCTRRHAEYCKSNQKADKDNRDNVRMEIKPEDTPRVSLAVRNAKEEEGLAIYGAKHMAMEVNRKLTLREDQLLHMLEEEEKEHKIQKNYELVVKRAVGSAGVPNQAFWKKDRPSWLPELEASEDEVMGGSE